MKFAFQIALTAAIALAGCATTSDAPETVHTPNPTRVTVTPANGAFVAEFAFPSASPVWAFHRSALRRTDRQPWRPDSWTVRTPGVELVRIGRYDALASTDGSPMPAKVEVQFDPAAVDLIADYDPALTFTNGTVALFSGAFSAFPVDSRDTLVDYAGSEPSPGTRVVMVNPGGAVFHGGRYIQRAEFAEDGYGIYGDVAVDPSTPVARIFDPALPSWLALSLDTATPEIFRLYESRLGPHGGDRPLVIASYVVSGFSGVSQGGSVLPGTIAMRFEGTGLTNPDEAVAANTIWFIAHEAAHFWLGQAMSYDSRDRAWITEGGADLMAMRAAATLDTNFAPDDFIARATDDCADALRKSGVEAARQRDEQRPYYACGMLFALAVDRAGAARGKDFFDFTRALIADQTDGEVNAEEWFAAASRFGVAPAKVALMRRMLSEPGTDPERDLEWLLDR